MADEPKAGHGGARPGAGRKPKPAVKVDIAETSEPLEFLLAIMNNRDVDAAMRLRAAVTAAQYKHVKRSDGGKKDEKQKAADVAASGKFRPAAPPKLVVNNR